MTAMPIVDERKSETPSPQEQMRRRTSRLWLLGFFGGLRGVNTPTAILLTVVSLVLVVLLLRFVMN